MNIKLIRQFYDSEEYLEKLRGRAENMKRMAEDDTYRDYMMNEVYPYGEEGCYKFIEDYMFLILPEFGDAIKPFFLFPYQKRIIKKIIDAEIDGGDIELLIDKPRGMGITWIFVAFMYWKWLFCPNWSSFVLSRTETEVDTGTASPGDSIFGKIRWMMKKTPKWILPEGFKVKGEKGTSTDSTLRILNPHTEGSIIGSSTNSNAGRSRRYSMIFIDECFSIDRFTEVHRSLQTVARINCYISTTKASREAKKFKDACEEAGNYISLEWRDHPWKDQEWYEQQLKKAEFDPEIMKEVDKGYAVSEKMQYYPEIKFAKTAIIQYNPELPIYCGLDFGKGDLTVIIWVQFDGNQINIIGCYFNKNKGKAEWYAPFLNPESEIEEGFQYTAKAKEDMKLFRSWKKPTAYFGEVAHKISSMANNQSIAGVLAKCGIRILYNTYAIEYEPRRKATSLLLPRMVFNEASEQVMELYDAIMNSRYKSSAASKRTTMEPVHDDEIADFRAALENICVNIGRIFKHQRKDVSESMNKGGYVQKLIDSLRV